MSRCNNCKAASQACSFVVKIKKEKAKVKDGGSVKSEKGKGKEKFVEVKERPKPAKKKRNTRSTGIILDSDEEYSIPSSSTSRAPGKGELFSFKNLLLSLIVFPFFLVISYVGKPPPGLEIPSRFSGPSKGHDLEDVERTLRDLETGRVKDYAREVLADAIAYDLARAKFHAMRASKGKEEYRKLNLR